MVLVGEFVFILISMRDQPTISRNSSRGSNNHNMLVRVFPPNTGILHTKQAKRLSSDTMLRNNMYTSMSKL